MVQIRPDSAARACVLPLSAAQTTPRGRCALRRRHTKLSSWMQRHHRWVVIVAVMSIVSGPVTARADDVQVNTYTTGLQGFPSVSLDADGDFVVVWQSFGSSGTDDFFSIQGQRFASDGSPVDSEFQVNTYTTSSQKPTLGVAGRGRRFRRRVE